MMRTVANGKGLRFLIASCHEVDSGVARGNGGKRSPSKPFEYGPCGELRSLRYFKSVVFREFGWATFRELAS